MYIMKKCEHNLFSQVINFKEFSFLSNLCIKHLKQTQITLLSSDNGLEKFNILKLILYFYVLVIICIKHLKNKNNKTANI